MVAVLYGGALRRSRGRIPKRRGAIARPMLALLVLMLGSLWGLGGAPATAQIPLSIGDLPQQLYPQLPDLPLENQYRDRATGETAQDSTLLRRLVRYHLYVKARSPFSRLDWKLTLADYLGANQYLTAEEYPDGTRLDANPLDGDMTAIRALNRRDREALIDVLLTGFTQRFQEPGVDREAPTPETAAPAPVIRQGGADALRLD